MSTARAQLAMWIEQEHPELFQALYAAAHAAGTQSRGAVLKGFGDDGTDDESWFNPATGSDPTLVPITLDTNTISAPNITMDVTPDSGSAISSAWGGITNAAESVGNWLVSPSGVNAVAQVGTAYFKTQGAIAQQQTQAQILQAQIQAAQQGQSPYPVTYVTNAAGQRVPVYVTQSPTGLLPGSYGNAAPQVPAGLQVAIANGSAQPITLADGSVGYTITSSILSTLTSNPLLWLLAAGVLLAAVL